MGDQRENKKKKIVIILVVLAVAVVGFNILGYQTTETQETAVYMVSPFSSVVIVGAGLVTLITLFIYKKVKE